MKLHYLNTLLLAVFIVALPGTARANGILKGTLIDSNHLPVPGHTINYTNTDSSRNTVQTNEKGEFLIDAPEGIYLVWVDRPAGCGFNEVLEFPLREGETVEGLVLHLPCAFPILQNKVSGTVRGQCAAVSPVEVKAYHPLGGVISSTTLSIDGTYELQVVTSYDFVVGISSPDNQACDFTTIYYPNTSEIGEAVVFSTGQDYNGINFILPGPGGQPLAYYAGKVTDPQSQPIEDVVVSSFGALTDTTDENGEFMLAFFTLSRSDTLLDGDSLNRVSAATVEFTHPAYFTHQEFVQIEEGDSLVGQEITLEPLPATYAVSGRVTDSGGNPLSAYLTFYSSDSPFRFYTETDANGNYEVSVFESAYYIRCDARLTGDFEGIIVKIKWYDNVEDFANATVLEVNGDLGGIDFSFEPLEVRGSISGTVTDRSSGAPLENALIWVQIFTSSDSALIHTDAEGNYTVNLLMDGSPIVEGEEYYILCEKEGYVPLFYDNATSRFDATPVVLTEDNQNVTGIDFSLYPPGSPGTNTVSGALWDFSGNSLAQAEVMMISADGKTIVAKYSGIDGRYSFTALPDGIYYLLAHAPDYAPLYYPGSETWEDASQIVLTGGTFADHMDVQLARLQEFGAEIRGEVESITGEGLSGTVVSVYTSEGKPVSGNISLVNGQFALSGLPNGEYTIRASKVGYQSRSHPTPVKVDLNVASVISGVKLQLDILSATGNANNNHPPREFRLHPNYPNPFNPATLINYDLPVESNVSIGIYNLLGQKIRTLVNEKQTAGRKSVVWDGRDQFNAQVSSGIYIYMIQAGDYRQSRKMVLLR